MSLAHVLGSPSSSTRRLTAFLLALGAVVAASAGCSSDDTSATPTDAGGGMCADGGGPVSGTNPDHCMGMFQDVATCVSGIPDGGMDTDGGTDTFPDPSIGTKDMDDDCKYMVSYTNDCVLQDQQGGVGTTFVATLTSLSNNMAPVGGSKQTYLEAFLDINHPALGGGNATEGPAGVYTFEPLHFNAAGKWTVRFHFFGNCSDKPEDSPHAHRAFFINVP